MKIRDILHNSSWFQVYNLVKSDIKTRYARNLFGSVWAVLDPFIYIIVIWIIFKYSLKSPVINDIPYITFLIPGYIIFDFFSKALSHSVVSFRTYSYLLNSNNFNHLLLPVIQILSELSIHLLVLIISIPVLLLNDIAFSIYWIQIIYYILAACIFVTGISFLCSSVYMFFPDIKILTDILLRLLFFITPVFWNMSALPQKIQFIFKLNPLFYLVSGYRDCLIYNTGFWQKPALTCYFWFVSFILMVAGLIIYKRLQPHFAESA